MPYDPLPPCAAVHPTPRVVAIARAVDAISMARKLRVEPVTTFRAPWSRDGRPRQITSRGSAAMWLTHARFWRGVAER